MNSSIIKQCQLTGMSFFEPHEKRFDRTGDPQHPHQIRSHADPILVTVKADITSPGVNKRVVVKRNADVNP